MSMCTSYCPLHLTTKGGWYIWQLIWECHLKMWTHFEIFSCCTAGLFILHTKDLTRMSVSTQREREGMSICETVKTQKWYYLHNMRSAYFPINRRLCVCVERERERETERERDRERESKRERLCPSVKQWKHRNGTISVIPDLHISLLIGDCIERERGQERLREAMSICETVKTQKWYYLCNTRSAYFPIDRRLHRERERARKAERERLCPSMKWWKHWNDTISIIWDLHIPYW